jgi:hypothetical protein
VAVGSRVEPMSCQKRSRGPQAVALPALRRRAAVKSLEVV